MKIYLPPKVRIIDLSEEDVILNSSAAEEESFSVNKNDYADEALSHKKSIWKSNDDWLSN